MKEDKKNKKELKWIYLDTRENFKHGLFIIPIFGGIIFVNIDLCNQILLSYELKLDYIVMAVFPVLYLLVFLYNVINRTSVFAYYLWLLMMPSILIPIGIPFVVILKKSILDVDVLSFYVMGTIIVFSIIFRMDIKLERKIFKFYATKSKFIDVSRRLIHIGKRNVGGMYSTTRMSPHFEVLYIPLFFFLYYFFTYGLPESMHDIGYNELKFFPLLWVVSFASWFMFPPVFSSILVEYLAIRRYEKEHNIKFRTNFVLVEERFKEFNEKRKRRGLKPKSLAWAFIRGNLIELMEEEEKRG